MSDEPIGPVLDALGVTISRDPGQRVTEALVIMKSVDLETGAVVLKIESNDLDWIAKWGLHTAADEAFRSLTPRYEGPDED